VFTLGNLKSAIRQQLWPAGRAKNLEAAHDQAFIDALIDLQTWVPCLRVNNHTLVPQCATFYNCGLTVFDAPRGSNLRLSVIDKINPTTHAEDATAPDDWCSEIPYTQVDACHVKAYLARSASCGCCLPIAAFFALDPLLCAKAAFPVPTDEGLPPGLPLLPLGFHYPQFSTDRKNGRAGAGVWAQETGKVFIAPWIQTTETVVLKWEGIKRTWSDADPIDDDPLLLQAVKEYVRWDHADKWDKDEAEAARALIAYAGGPGVVGAREKLVHQCREETRVRGCEPSHARSATITNLFFNDQQSATAECAQGTVGDPKTVTIPSGTVGSAISKADANQKARDQAQTQATAMLVCVTAPVTYLNEAQTAIASCQGEAGAPPPDGNPITVTVAAGTVSSTVSQADANAKALAQAQAAADAQLVCTFWNKAQTYTASCPSPSTGTDVTVTIPAHTYSSMLSQADADTQAANAAKAQAEGALVCSGGGTVYYNTPQSRGDKACGAVQNGMLTYLVNVTVNVAANAFTSVISQADANQQAINYAQQRAHDEAQKRCHDGQFGTFVINYP
jgi:hypothetical protein